MATVTFTYNALHTKTLKECIKNTKKNCKSFKLDKRNAVGIETTADKPIFLYAQWTQFGLQDFAGEIYSRHLFSYGGLGNHMTSYNPRWRRAGNLKANIGDMQTPFLPDTVTSSLGFQPKFEIGQYILQFKIRLL